MIARLRQWPWAEGEGRQTGEMVWRYNQIRLGEQADLVGSMKEEPKKPLKSPG